MTLIPNETDSEKLAYKREKMVGWYDPGQLMKTANEVVVSTILGKHADQRLVQALNPEKIQTYEYTKEFRVTGEGPNTSASGEWVAREEIWVEENEHTISRLVAQRCPLSRRERAGVRGNSKGTIYHATLIP